MKVRGGGPSSGIALSPIHHGSREDKGPQCSTEVFAVIDLNQGWASASGVGPLFEVAIVAGALPQAARTLAPNEAHPRAGRPNLLRRSRRPVSCRSVMSSLHPIYRLTPQPGSASLKLCSLPANGDIHQNPADIAFSRSVSLWRHGEELPGPGHALELMFASFREWDVGPNDEVLDCARDEDLSGSGDRAERERRCGRPARRGRLLALHTLRYEARPGS